MIKQSIVMVFPLLVLTGVIQAQINNELDDFHHYDFKAGEKILFEDNGSAYVNGQIPIQWNVEGGKAIEVTETNDQYISILEYYTRLTPKIKGLKSLPDTFSLEYDTWLDAGYDGNPGIEIHLVNAEQEILITPNKHEMSCSYPQDGHADKNNPEEYFGENKFYNRWVHISIAFMHKQLTVYLDQYKMIEIADTYLKPIGLTVTGNASGQMKILLKNFRLAKNIPHGLKLVKGKFITHAIKFDVNKAVLKPESMQVLNEVAAYMKSNNNVRFEIGGHTDADGDETANLALSEKRALAVKNQLVNMGIDQSRLMTKGYGESKPLSPNTSPEGKANNRRVEFTKL